MASEPKTSKVDTEQEDSVPEISRDDLDLEGVEVIGEGAYGTVFKTKWKSKDRDVAAKQVHYSKEEKEEVEHEIRILCRLLHPNIVVLHGVLQAAVVSSVVAKSKGAFTIILELCTKGSLKKYLQENREVKLSPAQFTTWATQAARAIEYLHKKGVIHKDIKSENYLIADDDVLKLTDFGISKFADKTLQNATQRGTPAYMPPEIHKEQELSPKFDFFSYAVVVWELLTRKIPFYGIEPHRIILLTCRNDLRLKIPADCPEDLAKLMKQCWEEDRNRRPNIEGILSVVSKPRDTLEDTERAKQESLELAVPRENLELRSYQEELARPALPGPDGYKNTVIVAPTGSGKTIVAVKVVKEFLETRGLEGQRSSRVRPMKVVFLVNKILLVEQQTQVFKRFLEPDTIVGISGDMSTQVSVKYMLQEKSILVMTAQILVNAIDNKEVMLSEIGLVIFDECHNCQGGTPYTNIMAIYSDMKLSTNEPRPQIIGMTASLFYGQAFSDNQAEHNVLTLCANLDADIISTVQSTACLKELEDKQHIPDERIIEVPGRKKGDDPFATLINIMMETIERDMQNTEGWHTLVKVNTKLLACPTHARGRTVYLSWMSNFENNVESDVIITNVADKRKLMACFDHLKKYNACLDINANIRSKDALLHLEKFRDDLSGKQRGFDDTDRKLVKLFDEHKDQLRQISDNPAYHNPVLKKLEVVLKTAFKSSPDVAGKRGILFAKTRVFTEALKNWIEETDELRFLKPGYLIGSGKSGGISGMTKTEQVDLVERFRDGDHKLIIATSVAQEGLDISPCNVVVRYNHITSIVGRVQTRGRNRAENGVFYLVVDEQLKLSDKNVKIRIGEHIMMKATRSVQRKLADNNQEMREQIGQLQRKDRQERETRAKNAKDKKSLLIRDRVKFSCRKCSKFACYSDDIRCIQGQHRAVFSKEFGDKYDVQEENKRFSEPKDIDGVVFHKTIACAECKSRWGSLGTYMDMYLPMIKPEWFTLKGEQQGLRRSKVKKWSQVWFIVEDYDETC